MCSPLLIMAGATLIGGAMQGSAQREAANAEARAAETNAAIADAQAEQARQIGNLEEQKVLREVRRTLGAQRAAFGAGNVDPAMGTALDLQAETAREGAIDAMTVRANAMRQAWGFQSEASQYREGARVSRRAGQMAQRTTLLTSASRAYGQYAGGG